MKSIRSGPLRSITKQEREDLSDNAIGSRSKGLEVDLRLREFEISQLTQRNNFFMIFQGVMIAGLVQSQGTAAPLINFCMACLGMATSTLQIGMAGGAKYWQSRWEAATRSSEIAIVLELVRQRKVPIQTFTHDEEVLSKEERRQICEWNDQNPSDQITMDPEFIDGVVKLDIKPARKRWFRGALDLWVRKWAIEPKWSVSRIPIWIGAALLVFWVVIGANSCRVTGLDAARLAPSWLKLVPLKADPPK